MSSKPDVVFQNRLVRFYRKYAPTKMATVPDLVKSSKGKEEKAMAKLVKKYGPEPPAPITKKKLKKQSMKDVISQAMQSEKENKQSPNAGGSGGGGAAVVSSPIAGGASDDEDDLFADVLMDVSPSSGAGATGAAAPKPADDVDDLFDDLEL